MQVLAGFIMHRDPIRSGLGKLLDTLKRQKVPCDAAKIQINPNWEIYRRRGAIPIKNEPERLTSNWLSSLAEELA